MKEELVSITTARLAHDKGFDWVCDEKYWNIADGFPVVHVPTKSLLQKWLREKFNIHIEVTKSPSRWSWIARDLTSKPYGGKHYGIAYPARMSNTYEEALEDALQQILELI